MKPTKRPKPGANWRFLAQQGAKAFAVSSKEQPVEFDELCVDSWLHIERMTNRSWWMRLGSLWVWVTLDTNGDVDVTIQSAEYRDCGGRITVDAKEIHRAEAVPIRMREIGTGKENGVTVCGWDGRSATRVAKTGRGR